MTFVIDGQMFDSSKRRIVGVRSTDKRLHLVAIEDGDKQWSFCRLVMDLWAWYRDAGELGLVAGGRRPDENLCHSCLEVARERLHIAIGDAP